MTLSFGKYRSVVLSNIPDDYLCWVCACFKGGTKAHHAGEQVWRNIPEDEYVAVRDELKRRGYNTKGLWPVKE